MSGEEKVKAKPKAKPKAKSGEKVPRSKRGPLVHLVDLARECMDVPNCSVQRSRAFALVLPTLNAQGGSAPALDVVSKLFEILVATMESASDERNQEGA